MRKILLISTVLLLSAGAASAQRAQAVKSVQAQNGQNVQVVQPVQQTVTVSGPSAVPVTTIVPVQQTPATVVDSSTVIVPQKDMTRVQRRAFKADRFAFQVDSLVRSRNFLFYPNSMQETPSGSMSNIVADYYYFGLFVDSAEVHLPVVNEAMSMIKVLNFDSPIADYRLYPFQSGLSITFSMQSEGTPYAVRFVVSTLTGETVLMLVSPETTMKYVGYLSQWKLHEE